jgi:alpha/beta superfamily hydrolase
MQGNAMGTTPTSHSVSVGQARLRSFDLPGPAGRLEALLNAGRPDAEYAVLVCHPHPLGGGTMHNKVVYHTMKAFQSFGLPVLRFNFRGTGRSEGQHDQGRGEVQDVSAALDWLDGEFRLPLLFAGFSFGANVGLRACCGDHRVKGLVALGLPVRAEGRGYTYNFLPGCTQPKLFASGASDEFGPQAEVEAIVQTAPEPRSLVWIAGGDHFFAGHLEELQAAIRGWVGAHFLPHRLPSESA